MKKVFSMMLMCSLSAVVTSSFAEEDQGYIVNAGDVLHVMVWKEDELTRDAMVRPDGVISFPLIGEVKVHDTTIRELTDKITDGLRKYIPDPVVAVSVKSLTGNRVYILGKVNNPGVFPMSQKIDVVQALAMAGGLTAYASAGNIKILRRFNETQEVYKFDYSDVEDGVALEQNITLQSGDTIIVP
jgi:polysaccharide export outer membrane protein